MAQDRYASTLTVIVCVEDLPARNALVTGQGEQMDVKLTTEPGKILRKL